MAALWLMIWEEKKLPKEWYQCLVIFFLKKHNLKLCENNRNHQPHQSSQQSHATHHLQLIEK
ncbi:hypothetical protein DPMN_102069 [Dreissena polymorpha]|uniref:Uncharacterized protein n=1 Tax=Dreissena polymorpha TaxID=45954 RepID=A0A9D4RAM9_DREPO|nr:hypothetical protein DPMN_102069 [Dreissena polymorpha]